MTSKQANLGKTVDGLLESLPSVWGRIRSNLRVAAIEGFDITLDQFHVLRHIRQGYDSVKDLAEKKRISRPAVSQAVEILAQKGLVTRAQESEDRRCVRLELTARAKEVLDANYEENRAWMRERMGSLTEAELLTIREAMRILRETFTPEED